MADISILDEETQAVLNQCTQEAAEELNTLKVDPDDEMMILVFHWNQMWGSSALGFGGVGFSAMTNALTVVVTDVNTQQCLVFHEGRRAYLTTFSEDIIEGIAYRNLPGQDEFLKKANEKA